jgi:hypothetical protein
MNRHGHGSEPPVTDRLDAFRLSPETADVPLRAPLDQHQPSDLSPLLHADHTLLLARPTQIRRASTAGRTTPTPHEVA